MPHWQIRCKFKWPYGKAVARQAMDRAPCLCLKTFVTKLFITSLYLGMQIISSLYITSLTNSSNSEGSAPKDIHMETFNEIQGLCCKQLANTQNCRRDCKQYSSEHHKLGRDSVFYNVNVLSVLQQEAINVL